MRAAVFVPLSCLLACSIALVACGSDPAAPIIDPGKENEDGGTANTDGAATGDTAQPASYPAGPYGYDMGQTIPDFKFSGWKNPMAAGYDTAKLEQIALHDFWNPTKDTAKPRAMLITWSALWCSVCQIQAGGDEGYGIAPAMEEYKAWHPKGVEFLEAIFEDDNYQPSVPSNLKTWTKTYKFEFPSVLDSNLDSSGVTFQRSAAPYNMVVDLTTMKISYAKAGLFDAAAAEDEFTAIVGGQ